MYYSVVTRSSLLAQRQTELFTRAFSETYPEVTFNVTMLKTQGDRVLGSIHNLKRAFVGELETALLDGRADIAVHSLKDMSVFYQPGLCIAAVLPRGEVRDVFVSHQVDRLEMLPAGARVGTCSARRAAQIRSANPAVQVVLCRGNVQTRLQKLESGQYDALILAGAGLVRLGIHQSDDLNVTPLSVENFVPAGGQGAIAIQVQANQSMLLMQVAGINDKVTYRAVMIEREIIRKFGGNCSTPLGVYVQSGSAGYHVFVFLGDVFGRVAINRKAFWPYDDSGYSDLIDNLVKSVLESGGQLVLNEYQSDLEKVFND